MKSARCSGPILCAVPSTMPLSMSSAEPTPCAAPARLSARAARVLPALMRGTVWGRVDAVRACAERPAMPAEMQAAAGVVSGIHTRVQTLHAFL